MLRMLYKDDFHFLYLSYFLYYVLDFALLSDIDFSKI